MVKGNIVPNVQSVPPVCSITLIQTMSSTWAINASAQAAYTRFAAVAILCCCFLLVQLQRSLERAASKHRNNCFPHRFRTAAVLAPAVRISGSTAGSYPSLIIGAPRVGCGRFASKGSYSAVSSASVDSQQLALVSVWPVAHGPGTDGSVLVIRSIKMIAVRGYEFLGRFTPYHVHFVCHESSGSVIRSINRVLILASMDVVRGSCVVCSVRGSCMRPCVE